MDYTIGDFAWFVWSTCVFWLSRLSVIIVSLSVRGPVGAACDWQGVSPLATHTLLSSCLTSPNTWQCCTFQGWIASRLSFWRLHSVQLLMLSMLLFFLFFVRKKTWNLKINFCLLLIAHTFEILHKLLLESETSVMVVVVTLTDAAWRVFQRGRNPTCPPSSQHLATAERLSRQVAFIFINTGQIAFGGT